MIALFAQAPALPLHSAGKYVAGAYIVFVLVLLIYVAIMGVRLTRNQKELAELRLLVADREREEDESPKESEPVA
jgi:flagellar biosynthesis/type III secretory pathway M-ring protein FliF/YscJ